MINILIVDDNPEKQKKIKNAITSVLSEDKYGGCSGCRVLLGLWGW